MSDQFEGDPLTNENGDETNDIHDPILDEELDAELREYLKNAPDGGFPDGSDLEDTLFEDNVDSEDFLKSSLNEDLFITVSDPEKHLHTLDTYISYKVTTKTSRSAFDSSEFVVRRRYHDFVWLSDMLQNEFPTLIIPPLPSKFIVKGIIDRFSPEFTETRCRALNRFLQRISNHPVVSFSEFLKTFLTSENFTPTKKGGLLSRVTGSLKWNKARNPDFEDAADSVTLFGEKMNVMDRINERLLTENVELCKEIKDFSIAITNWARHEEEAIESSMLNISNSLEECAEVAGAIQDVNEFDIIPTIKEYNLYADVVKQTLSRRDEFEARLVKCEEELSTKNEEKENLQKTDQSYSLGALMGKSPEVVRQEKYEKLMQQVEEISEQKEKLSDELLKANTAFRNDIARWKKQKTQDMAAIFSKMAGAQVSYNESCISAWNKTLASIQSEASSKEAGETTPDT